MSGPLEGFLLAERMKAYWLASRVLRDPGSAQDQRQRATCVLRLLAQCEPTHRLRDAAAATMANGTARNTAGRSALLLNRQTSAAPVLWLPR